MNLWSQLRLLGITKEEHIRPILKKMGNGRVEKSRDRSQQVNNFYRVIKNKVNKANIDRMKQRKTSGERDFPGDPVIKIRASSVGGTGLIPG